MSKIKQVYAVRKKNGDYFNGPLKQVIMYGNNEFLDCCSVCYKFNSIINHEKDLYCVKKNVPFSNRNIFRNNSSRRTFNVCINFQNPLLR